MNSGSSNASSYESLINELTQRFQMFPSVEAIAVGGSLASSCADATSDIDLYVYTPTVLPLKAREAIVADMGASCADLNLHFWDLGDEWVDAATGIEIDVMYWEPAWVESQLDRVLRQYQPSMGYSTCFWRTVRQSRMLFDRRGWFTRLQQQCEQPYPEPLRLAIIAKNHTVLRRVIPGYAHQIEKASRRGDLVSVNHRVAAMLASYFDVIFALNRVPHPGEKRLIAYAQAQCERLPANMAEHIEAVLQAAGVADGRIVDCVQALLDRLDDLLRQEGFDPETSAPLSERKEEQRR